LQPKPTKNPDDTRFRVLRVLARNPNLTQREIAAQLAMSTSGLNYVLHALVGRGLIKVRNFVRSSNKLGYAYLLTPQGVVEKTRLTQDFVARKLAERAALDAGIRDILAQGDDVPAGGAGGGNLRLTKD
jgi:EPS-associated MarR family transcriptional regulator